MMSSMTWVHPVFVVLPHRSWSAAWHCAVGSLDTVAVPCVWSTGLALHCSRLSTHLAGIKCAGCTHVLYAHDGPNVMRLENIRACIGNMRA
jgi:hypothetical protein